MIECASEEYGFSWTLTGHVTPEPVTSAVMTHMFMVSAPLRDNVVLTSAAGCCCRLSELRKILYRVSEFGPPARAYNARPFLDPTRLPARP